MHVVKKKPFYWYMSDAKGAKHMTILLELEYDVLDRVFHCSARKRQTPRDMWPSPRPATPEELAIAKAQLSPEELAACLAESINPSPWRRAAAEGERAVAASVQAQTRSYAADAARCLLQTPIGSRIVQPNGPIKIGGGA